MSFINEMSIRLGSKSKTDFNQIVILAGGAGSGKGFVKNTVLDINGMVYDVDEMKKVIKRTTDLKAKIKEKYGIDWDKLDTKNPDDTSKMHEIVSDMKLDVRKMDGMFRAGLDSKSGEKPNLIFDVTAKNIDKIKFIASKAIAAGYDPKNIHIVWVVTNIDVAIEQNETRDRVVRQDILLKTHEGASFTMHDVLTNGNSIKSLVDGDIVVVFNTKGKASDVKFSSAGGMYVKKMQFLKVKKAGQPISSYDSIVDEIMQDVPDPSIWKDKMNEGVIQGAKKMLKKVKAYSRLKQRKERHARDEEEPFVFGGSEYDDDDVGIGSTRWSIKHGK